MDWQERVDKNVGQGLPVAPRPGVIKGDEAEIQRRFREILALCEGEGEDEDDLPPLSSK